LVGLVGRERAAQATASASASRSIRNFIVLPYLLVIAQAYDEGETVR
jgi:hypothetical protein